MSGARQDCAPYGHDNLKWPTVGQIAYKEKVAAVSRAIESTDPVILGVTYSGKSGDEISMIPEKERTRYTGRIVDVFADGSVAIHALFDTTVIWPKYVPCGTSVYLIDAT